MRLKKEDTVTVIKGKDKGKKGRVLKVIPETSMVIVENVNMIKRHMRKTRENPKGGIIVKESPVRIPNLMLVCPRCNKSTRVGLMILTDGDKKRVCKKCKEII